MDNPNVRTVNLRRHSSLPGPLHSLRKGRGRSGSVGSPPPPPPVWSSVHAGGCGTPPRPPGGDVLLLQAKSNPYIGWFRHSPPTQWLLALQQQQQMQRGTTTKLGKHLLFRTRNNTTPGPVKKLFPSSEVETAEEFRSFVRRGGDRGETTLLRMTAQELLRLRREELAWPAYLLASKRLRGGGGGSNPTSAAERERQLSHQLDLVAAQLRQQSVASPSATVKILSRLACWFLDVPPQQPITAKDVCALQRIPEATREEEEEDEEESSYSSSSLSSSSSSLSSCSSYDNYDTVGGSRAMSSSLDLGRHVSSQAEAWHAERSVMEGGGGGGGSSTSNARRLDYDITQMDIVRMTRIASRHLDVHSILQLPTVTYQAESRQDEGPEEEEPESAAERQNNQAPMEDVVEQQDCQHGTEWSWMMVQREDSCSESDSSSVEQEQEKGSVSEIEQEQAVCVICLEHFQTGERLRVLPCRHSFHVGCIDRWLSGSHSFDDCYTTGCPTCKKRPDFLPSPADEASGSVPSWAFAAIGETLAARDSGHF